MPVLKERGTMKKEAMFYEQSGGSRVLCLLCAHHCRIADGETGFCRVRHNSEGKLYTSAYGEPAAVNIDPIEKKPLYHFLPGSRAFSIGTAGCNFHCGFCQNWQISQTGEAPGRNTLMPEDAVEQARAGGCRSIAYTYTEPTIFFEYAHDTAMLASSKNIRSVFVTNGYMTRKALDAARPWLDAANVDLKSFRNKFYSEICKARLKPVLKSIEHMKELGIWMEVTTLVVPGQNDSRGELADIAGFIATTGEEIPWHVSRFHADYEFNGAASTPIETLEMALEEGKKAGLAHVYPGNIAGSMSVKCPSCGKTVVERGMSGKPDISLKDGKCPSCEKTVAGVWE